MSVHAVQSTPAPPQPETHAATAAKAAQQQSASPLPQDRVTLSPAAQAKAVSAGKDSAGDSK